MSHSSRWRNSALAFLVVLIVASPCWAVRVAIVKSWNPGDNELPAIAEIANNWPAYGDIEVTIDTTLRNVDFFTYDDLVATGADVIWLSNPAGLFRHISFAEQQALAQYLGEGHDLFGTYLVFRNGGTSNVGLLNQFGLTPGGVLSTPVPADQEFDILDPMNAIFNGIPDPFMSGGFPNAQVPVDSEWSMFDVGGATLLAQTPDHRGILTLFQTANSHAIYVSEFIEHFGNPVDTQLLYNILTFEAEPTGECCRTDGACEISEQAECLEGNWTQGGSCAVNACPQPGACCLAGGGCDVLLEAVCAGDFWIEAGVCDVDSDEDTIPDGCDTCQGFDDLIDSDQDGNADGCDLCPGFDDNADEDLDTVPDDCDTCPGFDDTLDEDTDGVPDDCDACPGSDDQVDCNNNTVPDGCEVDNDCNENQVPDDCDIDQMTSLDCNTDDIPDECQIEGNDDDGDGVINECDLCDGDDTVLGLECDGSDADDCATGLNECLDGAVTCTDDPEVDDVDSDDDGVFDCNDLCADTPPDSDVLPDGCRARGGCCFPQQVCFENVLAIDCMAVGGTFLGHFFSCEDDPDGDEILGCEDGCPNDPQKDEPGQCGCGQSDGDTDEDGVADCIDGCPDDPGKLDPGICGCGTPEDDSDNDGVVDCLDLCPIDPFKIDPGICGCGIPDIDSDDDGAVNCLDGCPDDPDKTEPGVCGCSVPDDDSDEDGALDCVDGCPADPEKTVPGVCGCQVPDIDTDEDGALDCEDGCPGDPDKQDPELCGCGIPDVDADGDSIVDCLDLCPGTEPDTSVDKMGCPLQGACCFSVGVCIDDSSSGDCILVGGFYQGNGTTCGQPCSFEVDGDIDGNGRTNRADLTAWQGCSNGPSVPFDTLDCQQLDFDTDDDLDLRDFADFLLAFDGLCGDGIEDQDEGCDDANALPGDGCSPTCETEVCGNAILDPGEFCDDGADTPDCDADCSQAECGDGYINMAAGEACDDGNLEPGDGCDDNCQSERP